MHSCHFIECVQQSHEVYKAYPCIASGARIKIDLLSQDDALWLVILKEWVLEETYVSSSNIRHYWLLPVMPLGVNLKVNIGQLVGEREVKWFVLSDFLNIS